MRRHRWGQETKHYGYRARTCQDCGIERIQRFDRGFHWTEWQMTDGTYLDSVTQKTPPCEPLCPTCKNNHYVGADLKECPTCDGGRKKPNREHTVESPS